jgi:hypothetical protein
MATVKTYRATRALKVGEDDVRQYGDLVPEAASWENLRAYLASGYIEEVLVDEKDIPKVKTAPVKKTTAKKSSAPTKRRVVKKTSAAKKGKPSGIREEVV